MPLSFGIAVVPRSPAGLPRLRTRWARREGSAWAGHGAARRRGQREWQGFVLPLRSFIRLQYQP